MDHTSIVTEGGSLDNVTAQRARGCTSPAVGTANQ